MAPRTIAFQGELGAHSHAACLEAFPSDTPLPCPTFEDAFAALLEEKADLAVIPIENSVAGRVADVHHLLPSMEISIIGEHFSRIHHQLLVLPGTHLGDLHTVSSHVHALGQCRKVIRELGLSPIVAADTAGAARELCETGDNTRAVIASKLAASLYGLEVLRHNIEDEDHNTTRFLVMSKQGAHGQTSAITAPITSFLFRVRNVPAALYKGLGGFATNGVNMTKLESYQPEGLFSATEFYADIEGNPEDRAVRLAFEELSFFSTFVRILGVYPASPFRKNMRG